MGGVGGLEVPGKVLKDTGVDAGSNTRSTAIREARVSHPTQPPPIISHTSTPERDHDYPHFQGERERMHLCMAILSPAL